MSATPLTLQTQFALDAFLLDTQTMAPDQPVWRRLDTGARLQYDGLKSLLQKLGKTAGVNPCNPHRRFRRTFALLSLHNRMNIYALQRIMGHADLSVLRRYLAMGKSDKNHYRSISLLISTDNMVNYS